MRYFFKVTVTGRGRFPLDQLRRFEMFPLNVESVSEMETSFAAGKSERDYTLGMYANTLGGDGPCRARFESFGFSMVTDEIWKDGNIFEVNGEVVARYKEIAR